MPARRRFRGRQRGAHPHAAFRNGVQGTDVPLFDFNPESSGGVDALDPVLKINGISATPVFRYKGGDATSSSFPAWGYGEDLPIVSVGTEPTYNDGSPLMGGTNDDSVGFNASDYYKTSTSLSIGTGDMVWEFIAKTNTVGTRLASTRSATSTEYVGFQASSGPIFRFRASGTGTAVNTDSASLAADVWYHVLLFYDASGSAQFYVNGAASGSAGVVSAVGDVDNVDGFALGALAYGATPFDGNIAYAAMWTSSDWLDTHLQATIAAERFAKLTGVYETRRGTVPSTATRATTATIVKQESAGVYQLYTVGAGWMRTSEPPWASAPGFHSELAGTNLATYSEDLSNAAWTKTNSTASTTSVSTPDGGTSTTATIAEDGTAATSHFITQSLTVTAGSATLSAFLKAANRTWAAIQNADVTGGSVYFNLSTGAIGATGSGIDDVTIEDYGNGWYRCRATWTVDGTSDVYRIYAAEGDGDVTFDGLTQDSIYAFGIQVEASPLATSYVKTTTASATRNADVLDYAVSEGTHYTASSGSFVLEYTGPDIDLSTEADIGAIYLNSSNRILSYVQASSDIIRDLGADGGVTQWSFASAVDGFDGVRKQLVISFGTNDVQSYVDGTSYGTDTSATVDSGLDTITVGHSGSGTNQPNAIVHRVRTYHRKRVLP